jgi:signal transduction histidine kinase
MAYKQIKKFQVSAYSVTHTLQVQDGINILFSHYFRLESEEFKAELFRDTITNPVFQTYLESGQIALENLSELTSDNSSQLVRLNEIKSLQDSLYHTLRIKNSLPSAIFEKEISKSLFQIREVNDEMRAEERRLLQHREENYEFTKIFAPITSLILSFFSLFVFLVAFIRIYKDKRRFRESDTFLRSVMANSNNIVNFYTPIFDPQGNIVDFEIKFANARNRDYFGLHPENIIGKKVSEVFPFLKLNGEIQGLISAFNNQKAITFDRQIALKDLRMWIRSSVNPLLNGLLVTAQNVTEEEEAKAEQLILKEQALDDNLKLREMQSFLNKVLASTENVISYFTPIFDDVNKIVDFRIQFHNEQIKYVLQVEASQLEQKLMSTYFPMHFENGVFELLVKCINDGKTARFERPYEFKGVKFWFKTTIVKLDNGVLTTSTDTTSEKTIAKNLNSLNKKLEKQNTKLKGNRAFLTNLFKSISHIVMHFNSIRNNEGRIIDLEIQFVNGRINDFLGIHPNQIKFKKVSEVFPTIFETGVFEKLVDAIENNRSITYETTFELNNKMHWFQATAIKLGDGVTVTTVDVTDDKKQKEQLRVRNIELKKSNVDLEAFNRVASHDLQEPLRKIQLFISRILENRSDPLSATNREYFDKIENAATRMRSLIVNLLTYSHLDGKHQDFESVDLNDVLAKVKEDLYTIISETSVSIKEENLPIVSGVSYQLEQLFINLISNAMKYGNTTNKTIIEIRCEKVHQKQIEADFFKKNSFYFKITVKDNGIGFDPEYSKKIFEVFQRLHQNSEYSGTGIGLAICKKIVENHYGFIQATSEPNRGSTFSILLPA